MTPCQEPVWKRPKVSRRRQSRMFRQGFSARGERRRLTSAGIGTDSQRGSVGLCGGHGINAAESSGGDWHSLCFPEVGGGMAERVLAGKNVGWKVIPSPKPGLRTDSGDRSRKLCQSSLDYLVSSPRISEFRLAVVVLQRRNQAKRAPHVRAFLQPSRHSTTQLRFSSEC